MFKAIYTVLLLISVLEFFQLSKQDDAADFEKVKDLLINCTQNEANTEKLLNFLCTSRTERQRLALRDAYNREAKPSTLSQTLGARFSGELRDLLVALITPKNEFFADQVHDSFSYFHTDCMTLVEILCTNEDLGPTKREYKDLYGTRLDQDIDTYTSEEFHTLLKALTTESRQHSFETYKDAIKLLQSGELNRTIKKESTFAEIFATHSFASLAETFDHYQNISGRSLRNVTESLFTGTFRAGLLAIYDSVIDRNGYFAQVLYRTMYGFGTDDQALIRVIVTQLDNMAQIKRKFRIKFKAELRDYIADDTSGDYRKCLLKLVDG